MAWSTDALAEILAGTLAASLLIEGTSLIDSSLGSLVISASAAGAMLVKVPLVVVVMLYERQCREWDVVVLCQYLSVLVVLWCSSVLSPYLFF